MFNPYLPANHQDAGEEVEEEPTITGEDLQELLAEEANLND